MMALKGIASFSLILVCYFSSPIFAYPTAAKSLEQFGYDMVFPPGRTRGVAQSGYGTRWTGGIVPYVMSNAFTAEQQTLIVNSMRQIEQETAMNNRPCVRFRPKLSTDEYSISIVTGVGCSAYVGQNTDWHGELTMTLQVPTTPYDSHCMFEGTIIHELVHVLGFKHEHQRPDRDDYITINYANVQDGFASAFDKLSYSEVDTQQTPYDYNSIMHYGKTAFSSNGLPTIVPKKQAAVMDSQGKLSPIDVKEIQLFYQCQ